MLDMRTTKTGKTRKRPRYNLGKLLDQLTPDNQPKSFDDAPVGEEEL